MIWRSVLIVALLQLTNCRHHDNVVIVQNEGSSGTSSKYLVVTWSPDEDGGIGGCEFFRDQTLIAEVLDSYLGSSIQKVTDKELESLLKECTEISMRKRRDVHAEENLEESEVPIEEQEAAVAVDDDDNAGNNVEAAEGTTEGYDGWNVIFPGTKWCGAGDIAKNYDDLGMHSDTDKCCRAHDHCDDLLAPGASRNGLKNNSPFTKLSCQCDNDFYDCLDNVDSIISNKIGNMYFNLLRRDCYELNYPLTKKCKTYRSFLKITCKEYARNTKAEKVYQWKPAKLYKKLPFPGPITVTLPF